MDLLLMGVDFEAGAAGAVSLAAKNKQITRTIIDGSALNLVARML
jgi:hypothetical protein